MNLNMSTVITQTKMIMITKEKFLAYVRVQNSGVIDMLDVETGTSLSGLTKDEYWEIINNYSKYRTEFLGK